MALVVNHAACNVLSSGGSVGLDISGSKVIVLIGYYGSVTITSVTVGGVAATRAVAEFPLTKLETWVLDNPTPGSSVPVQVVHNAGGQVAVGVFDVEGMSSGAAACIHTTTHQETNGITINRGIASGEDYGTFSLVWQNVAGWTATGDQSEDADVSGVAIGHVSSTSGAGDLHAWSCSFSTWHYLYVVAIKAEVLESVPAPMIGGGF